VAASNPIRAVKFDPYRFSQYARDLAAAVGAMKFTITENTFFEQKERKIGEVMDAPVGPYRYERGPDGKMQRVAQFVEVAQEIPAMADPVAPPVNQMAAPAITKPSPIADPVKKVITGASGFGTDFKAQLAAAKAKIAAAQAQVGTALSNLDTAAARAVQVAAAIQAEADDLNASIGQVSNE
jgi:hypothetical protein